MPPWNVPSTTRRFVAFSSLFRPEGNDSLGRVPAGVSGKKQLMRALEEALRFPEYFGRNWDALSDCLRDLSWLPPGRVRLVHDALPHLPPKDLRASVDVLAIAAGALKPQESHERDRHHVFELLPS